MKEKMNKTKVKVKGMLKNTFLEMIGLKLKENLHQTLRMSPTMKTTVLKKNPTSSPQTTHPMQKSGYLQQVNTLVLPTILQHSRVML
jgi:hypothetical protein